MAAQADVQRTADRLAPAAQALAAAEDAFRIVGVRFRNGNAILVEVIAAQREVELARLNRVSAVVEHNNARARLRIVVGEHVRRSLPAAMIEQAWSQDE